MKTKRSNFSGKIGFVLAAAGSAVGLGNIWRFPYLAAKYGGGIFLLVYLILTLTFGFSLMIAEISLGRKTGLSAIGAFGKLSKKYAFIGWLASAVPVLILPYYCVIGGWIIKYFFAFLKGEMTLAANDEYFSNFISTSTEPVIWLALFLIITAVVIYIGVEKGIETVSKFSMPVLVCLSIFIAIYAITIPGAVAGVKYYIIPDFSAFSVKTVLAALGQLFYSLSLAMGIMITYGSYMKKEDSIEQSVKQIEIFDTGIAFLSGLMIVPAVFTFSGGDKAALNKGAGLMFITLPKVFNSMKFGHIVGCLFFMLVLFAALTSAISLMETVVSIVMDRFKFTRKKATICVAIFSIILALPSTLGYGVLSGVKPLGMDILDFFDFISNSFLMPIVAFLTCVFIGYIVGTKTIVEEIRHDGVFKREKLFVIMIKYVAPIFIFVIWLSSILDSLGIMKI